MSKTALGNPFEDEDFFSGKRGVKHVVNTIKSSDQPMASNFDPQNNKAYIIGTNRDGSAKKAKQRYTVANPYAPGKAGKLLFFIKNYSSGDQFYFPPYIQSIQNTENANWNSTNFLGRPEAIYTYNNSSRDASISFYVLTDYSERVDIGRDWGSDSMEKISVNFDEHFTDSDVSQNRKRRLEQEKLLKLKQDQIHAKEEINKKKEANSAEAVVNEVEEGKKQVEIKKGETVIEKGSAQIKAMKDKSAQKSRAKKLEEMKNSKAAGELTAESDLLQTESAATEKAIGNADKQFNRATNYSETNDTAGNIYNLNITKKEFNGSEIITKADDTINRIDTMKKGLMFQPAFFSGDKVDFVRKVEFLSKLTRPSAAPESPSTGFSFTKAPVCHIHLGDWWNHDIVVNSVSFDYADAPWTLEGGRVQPMWVLVNMSFNIIGPFQKFSSRPPLSTDEGGMYSPLIKRG